MHRTRIIFGFTALFLTAGIVVIAQHDHATTPKPAHQATTTAPKTAPKPAAVPHASATAAKPAPAPHASSKPVTTTAHKTAVAPPTKLTTTKPVKAVAATTPKATPAKATKPAKPTTTAAPATAKADKPKVEGKPKADKVEKVAKATTPSPTAPAPTTTSTTSLTPVQEKLKKNTNLAAKLAGQLPAGTDLMTAAAGFRNLGQFVAAVNVSNNLGVSFTQLKAKMVTGGMSLGQAIQAVRPLTASATIEAQRAEYDARGIIAESEQAPQAPAPTVTPASTTHKNKAKAKTPVR
jgi:outer membrane biosynthesis protein TonB